MIMANSIQVEPKYMKNHVFESLWYDMELEMALQ